MLTKAMKKNFQTILDAAEVDQLALVECTDAATGELVPTVCAVNFRDGEYEFVPLARLFTSDPYETLIPPIAEVV